MNEDDNKKEHLPLYGIGPIPCFPIVVLTTVAIYLLEKNIFLKKCQITQ